MTVSKSPRNQGVEPTCHGTVERLMLNVQVFYISTSIIATLD